MKKHIDLLGILQIAFGIVLLFIGIAIFTVLQGTGLIAAICERSGDGVLAMKVLSIIAVVVLIFAVVVALPVIIAGIGLLKRKSWARLLTLIFSAINLVNVPFGTMLSVYSFWVLLHDESIEYLK